MPNCARDTTDANRIKRDEKTVMAMACMYCHGHRHIRKPGSPLCPDCTKVIEYAQERTRRCPQQHRGTCDTCTIQCYKPSMRAEIKSIMAYSGPRMLFKHPVMAIRHLLKKRTTKGAS